MFSEYGAVYKTELHMKLAANHEDHVNIYICCSICAGDGKMRA